MIIEHGTWEYYKPAEMKEGFPPHAMFAKRVDDGADWYEYQATKPFGEGSVVMTAYELNGQLVVGAATFDYSAIFPPRARVLEETEYQGQTPQADFGQKTYDAATKTIGPKFVPPPTIFDVVAQMRVEIDALKAAR